MIIKYVGNKPSKMVEVGGKYFKFDPVCQFNEIFDLPIIEWLLHPDRAGLFVVSEVADKTPSVTHPEATKVAEPPPEASKEPQIKAEPPVLVPKGKDTAKDTAKRRGRPRKG